MMERTGERLARIVDRTGAVHAELAWIGHALDHLTVPGARVAGAIIRDPLLGPAHVIRDADGAVLTTMSALDWVRPTQIPAIAAPRKLPSGSGAAILNVIAVLAARAGVPALRYAGPYPTPALFHSLARSFRTTATEAAFTADVLARAMTLARDELPFDFVPAPHERVACARGHAELRDGLERVVIDGVSYERSGSPARLVEDRAELWFGDAAWATIATFADDGTLRDGPHAIPPCTSDVLGKEFPFVLRAALAELIAEAVPAPLTDDARARVTSAPIRWADLGARAAARDGGAFAVHAAIWDRIGPLGLGRLALAIAEALVPVVTQAVLADVALSSPAGDVP